jgi:pyruvate/2-oxoglutarate dehydrogenase complex dihydrolipoamide dehydrogenase (E3) component
MNAANQFDAIVIGSGKAGTPLASALAKHGLLTVLIDGRFVGSESVEEQALTKSLMASARVAHLSQRMVLPGFDRARNNPVVAP